MSPVLVRLREATISHLESVIRLRESELAEAAGLIQQREAVIRELEQHLTDDDAVDPKWPTLPLNEKIVACLATIDGWCTPAKAQWLARFISERRASHVLEIGVFGGKSLIPMALAAQSIGPAVVVGVEPWRADVAVAEPTNEANDDWWTKVDFAAREVALFRQCGEIRRAADDPHPGDGFRFRAGAVRAQRRNVRSRPCRRRA